MLTLRLQSLRKMHKYSREYMSEILGVSKFTYRAWEQGKHEPGIKHLIELSRMFNVSVDHLIGNDNYTQKVLIPKSNLNSKLENLLEELKTEIEKEIDEKIKEKLNDYDN